MTDRLSVKPVQISDAERLAEIFLLQKNTGNDERQIMTSIEKCGYPQKFHGNN